MTMKVRSKPVKIRGTSYGASLLTIHKCAADVAKWEVEPGAKGFFADVKQV